MRKALTVFVCLLALSVLWSCGSSSAPAAPSGTGLKTRAFVSQDVNAAQVGGGLLIIDAETDRRANAAPIVAGATPGMMVVSPNHNATVVFSSTDNALNVISNSQETSASHATLPGFTESIVISPDSQTAYIAIPTASPGLGQLPGIVQLYNLSAGSVSGQVDVPAVHYLSINNSGNRLLAFSDNSDSVSVITPSNIGTGQPVVQVVGGFDRPVAAFFLTDDNTAYVVNCGAECGGVSAGVQKLDLTTNTPSAPSPVPAASVAVVNGTTMYLAGTPVPASPCTGQQTAAASCGLLTVFDLSSMTVTNASPIVITDGYHNRIALGSNAQLFIGARTCTEIIPPNPPPQGAETRGCLSIYNTQTGAVIIPAVSGNVTGIQPIANRNIVYLVQGGELQIYDTTTNKLIANQIDISGEAVDVKTIDF